MAGFGVQVGSNLHQVGSKVGADGPKIGFLKDLVAYLQGVRHRIDFCMELGLIFVSFRRPRNLENRALVLAP